MFAIGLSLVILFGVSGGALFRYASNLAPALSRAEIIRLQEKYPTLVIPRNGRLSPAQIIDLQNRDHDQATVNLLYENWEYLYAERNKPEWQESNAKSLFKQSGYLKTIAWVLIAVAGLGLLLIAFSITRRKQTSH